MKLLTIEGNTQQLDGGAMFGNCPKELWKRWTTPDERNRIPLAARALYLELDDRKILFETGIGAFFEPKLRERFGVVEPEHMLLANLAKEGIDPASIDTVILSHLHFDHAGGLLPAYGKEEDLLFKNAKIYVGKRHWEHAQKPPMRERASFIPKLHEALKSSGRLVLVEGESHPDLNFVKFRYVDGHTIGLMMSVITCLKHPLLFVSDLCPGIPWVHLPITMGYDRFPEKVMEEKKETFEWLIQQEGALFFTHDPNVAISRLSQSPEGRFEPVPLEGSLLGSFQ